jgi:hypothetical protein
MVCFHSGDASSGLAVRLLAVAERRRQSLHAARANLVALLPATRWPPCRGFRHSQQRAHWIAERGRLDDAAQTPRSVSLETCRRAPPLQRTGLSAAARRRGLSVPDRSSIAQVPVISKIASAAHPAARTSPAANSRRPRSSSTRLPSLPTRLRVDHADLHTAAAASQESCRPESHHHMAPAHNPIHFL